MRIIIIGYMGAGKTTVGKALARTLGLPFYDLDWYIESRMRKTVSQLFAERGEEGFRKIEHNMLHEVAEFEDVIISCGGGTPCFFDNMDYLNQQGRDRLSECHPRGALQAPEDGQDRASAAQGKTPEEISRLHHQQLGEREPFYKRQPNTPSTSTCSTATTKSISQ